MSRPSNTIMIDVCRYFDTVPSAQWSVGDMAKHTARSSHTLQRHLRKHGQARAGVMIRTRRLDLALEALHAGKTITQVYRRIGGYSRPQALYRALVNAGRPASKERRK